ILLIAVLAMVPLVAASPSHAAKKMEVVIQDDGIFLYQSHYNRDAAYGHLRRLGASQLRINVLWWQTMPESQALARKKPGRIRYNWAVWDNAIARAKDFGIKVQLDLTGDPPVWACGNKRVPGVCDGFKPNAKAFGQFAQAAAKHFGRRVTRYSIWNEPNWFTWLQPLKSAPLLYRRLYQAGYAGVKKGNRRAKVFMGELAPYAQKRRSMAPLQFIREMVCVNKRLKKTRTARRDCKGGPLKLDGFAHHPYDFNVAPTKRRKGRDNVTMANLNALPAMLDKLRSKRLLKPSVKKVPLYLTEHGYFVKTTRRIPESKRSKYTVKAFDMAQRHPRVKQMLYYILVSPPADSPSAFFDLGLVAQDGTERGAFAALQKWIRNAARSGRVTKPGRCTAC
ncbi:MAG: hypothetical protein QOJ22_847, partial [Thermoleophilaceae bacterium]|nr:hypothetical protein [Thermoleophilaceae bacterium]